MLEISSKLRRVDIANIARDLFHPALSSRSVNASTSGITTRCIASRTAEFRRACGLAVLVFCWLSLTLPSVYAVFAFMICSAPTGLLIWINEYARRRNVFHARMFVARFLRQSPIRPCRKRRDKNKQPRRKKSLFHCGVHNFFRWSGVDFGKSPIHRIRSELETGSRLLHFEPNQRSPRLSRLVLELPASSFDPGQYRLALV